jgi:hypothetical protein
MRYTRYKITPRAIEIFKRQQISLISADQWWRLFWELWAELKLQPTEGCIVYPADKNVHPPTAALGQWHERGQRLYLQLCHLSGIKPSEDRTTPP